jgi:sugar phosphate isomerase/epimerase
MKHLYSMGYLTGNGVDPVSAVRIAAEHGYDMISFRLLPAGPGDQIPPLLDDDPLVREVMAAMRDTGLTMSDAEMIRLKPETRLGEFDRFIERIAQMGARHVLVAVDDTELARTKQNFAALCERLAPYRLTADLEFMPWTGVKDLTTAREIVEAADHPGAAVLFDALHFDRCGSTLDDFQQLPRALMNYVQICDGPVPFDPSDAELIRIARTARMIPGEGDIDLQAIAALIPADMMISVEVPNHALAQEIGASEVARRSLLAAKRLFSD